MPTTPYASVLLAVNAGAAAAGTIVAVADDVITCSTLSTIGWKTSNLPTKWQITAYPDGWVADTGWVLNVANGYFEYTVGGATGMLPPAITMPSAAEIAAGLWGKWKVRLLVNGGGGQLTDWTAGISVLSQTGLEDVALYEGFEFDTLRAWVGSYQRAARLWDTAIAGGIGGGASLGAGTPAVLTAAAGTQGALLTAAPFDHRHQVSTAICVTIGAANSIGVSTSLAKADHVHDHGALLGGDRHALAVASVSHGFISATNQAKLEGIEAGAQVTSFARVQTALGLASGAIAVNSQKITGLANGTNAADAVNFSQLNAIANGMRLKAPVRGASLANQVLSGALTEDGITYATNDRYGAKDQTDLTENGIYVVNTAGAWTRSTDADEDEELQPGTMFFVQEGTVNGNTGWAILSDTPIGIGSDNIVFTQVFGPGAYIAGAGLTQSGNTFNVVAHADGSIVVNANDIQVGILATDAQHGARGGGTQHAVVVAAGAAGFMSGADKTKLDGIPAAAAALGSADPLPPAVTAVVGAGILAAPVTHVHPWGAAGAGLDLRRPQHASGAGIKDSIRGQAAAAGAFVGGKLEIGGGDAGNGTVANGDTLLLLGEAPVGGLSAAFTICRSDGGANYLSVYYSDVLGRAVITSATNPYWNQGLRIAGTLSHVHATLTSSANITMTQGTGNHRRVVLVHNTTFEAPTGFEDGTELVLFITQGAGAPWTAAWNAAFKFPTGMSGTLIGNALDEVDVFRFILKVDQWVCVTHESY
jgi:hypothetical protein